MVDAHLAAQAGCRRARARRQRPRSPFAARLPEAIRTRFEHVVCVVAESNAWPYSGEKAGLRHELVHWVARRLATGETFDAVVAPQKPLAPSTVDRTGLSEERLRAGTPCAEALAAFGRFLRPGDVICSWGHYAPEVFEEAGGTLPAERIDLRATARRLSKEKAGRLEEYAGRIAPGATAAPLPDGRGGRRLGMLEAIVRAWRAMAALGTPESPGGGWEGTAPRGV